MYASELSPRRAPQAHNIGRSEVFSTSVTGERTTALLRRNCSNTGVSLSRLRSSRPSATTTELSRDGMRQPHASKPSFDIDEEDWKATSDISRPSATPV